MVALKIYSILLVVLSAMHLYEGVKFARRLEQDKDKLQILLRQLGDTVKELQIDLKEEGDQIEPIVEAEKTEQEVEDRGRGSVDTRRWDGAKPSVNDKVDNKRGRWDGGKPSAYDEDNNLESRRWDGGKPGVDENEKNLDSRRWDGAKPSVNHSDKKEENNFDEKSAKDASEGLQTTSEDNKAKEEKEVDLDLNAKLKTLLDLVRARVKKEQQ